MLLLHLPLFIKLRNPSRDGARMPHTKFSRSDKYIVEQRGNKQRADKQGAGYISHKTNLSFQM